MADGTKINASTVPGGDVIWTEDTLDARGKLQRVKLALGVVDTDAGDVSTSNPMPVAAASLPLPLGAAQDATLTGGNAKTQVQDGAGNTIGTSAHPLRTDPVGTTTQPTAIQSYPAVTPSTSLGAASGVAKASAGSLRALTATNRDALVRYLQIFDSPTAPVANQVPKYQWPIPANGGVAVIGTDFFSDGGWPFSTGIAWGFSTSAGVFASGATASECDFAATIV